MTPDSYPKNLRSECAEVISNHRIPAYLIGPGCTNSRSRRCDYQKEAQAGINFTASHNPPEYSGLKLSTHKGAAALPGCDRTD